MTFRTTKTKDLAVVTNEHHSVSGVDGRGTKVALVNTHDVLKKKEKVEEGRRFRISFLRC